MQVTLEGLKAKEVKEFDSVKSKDYKTEQIKIGETIEDIKKEREEEKKCSGCHELKKKDWDICNGEPNTELCSDCIIKRHKRHGLILPGYKIEGENIEFYSHTTGIEKFKLTDIKRVFEGIFANDVFPYSINTESKKVEIEECKCGCGKQIKKEEIDTNCFGITKETGEFLIKELNLKKQVGYQDEDSVSYEWVR